MTGVASSEEMEQMWTGESERALLLLWLPLTRLPRVLAAFNLLHSCIQPQWLTLEVSAVSLAWLPSVSCVFERFIA